MKKILLLPFLMLFAYMSGAQCVASFTNASVSSNNNLLQQLFTNTSAYGTISPNITIIANIYFGDNSMASLGSYSLAQHNYAAPGTYTVGLSIQKLDSSNNFAVICTDSTWQTITVGYTPCGSSITSVAGTNGSYTFAASTPAGTPGMTYSWTFGDGGTGTGASVTHTYASNGVYTVTLVATNGTCTYTNTRSVTISNVVLNCANLHALFSTTISNNQVNIINNSTTVPGYTRTSVYDYDDGTSVTTQSTHTYSAIGTYTIKQKVQWIGNNTVYCQDSTTHVITITTVPNFISGYIFGDSSVVIPDTFKVMLVQFNPTTNILSAVDSQIVSGFMSAAYSFNNPVPGNYLVKAIPTGVNVLSGTRIPTYHTSSFYWNTATTIVHTGLATINRNIWMLTGTPTSGPGFIGGNVSLGANKGAANGVAGMNIILLTAANQQVATTVTDANGEYQFNNLPIGNYTIFPESMNYATTPAGNVEITAAAPSVNNISFNQDNAQMNIKRRELGIGTTTKNMVLTVSPNPAHNILNISWKGVNANGAHLIITNITGQVVMDKEVRNTAGETLNVSSLQPGIYFLRGTQGLNGMAQKLVIE